MSAYAILIFPISYTGLTRSFMFIIINNNATDILLVGTMYPEEIRYKKMPDTLVASKRVVLERREDIVGIFESMRNELGKAASGPPMALLHIDSREENDVDACYPVEKDVFCPYKLHTVEGSECYSIMHRGGLGALDGKYGFLARHIYSRGLQIQPTALEIYHKIDIKDESQDIVEACLLIHPWKELLLKSIEKVLGKELASKASEMGKNLNAESSVLDRQEWVKRVVGLIASRTDENEKYLVMSPCADKFSSDRIHSLRKVYLQNKSIDDVLDAMKTDQNWYSEPYRDGEKIYVTKNPYRKKQYEESKDDSDRRKYYCHCPLIRDSPDIGIHHTFCYCGSGWFRQLWEGILGRSVSITLEKSLLKGDTTCQFCIDVGIPG